MRHLIKLPRKILIIPLLTLMTAGTAGLATAQAPPSYSHAELDKLGLGHEVDR